MFDGVSKRLWDVIEGYHKGPTSKVLRCRLYIHSERSGIIEVMTGTKDDFMIQRTVLTAEENRAIYKEISGYIGIGSVTELTIIIEPFALPEVKAKFYLT